MKNQLIIDKLTLKAAKEYVKKLPYIYPLVNIYPKERMLFFTQFKQLNTEFVFWPTITQVKSFDKYNKIIMKEEQLLPGYAFLLLPKRRDDLTLFFVFKKIYCRVLKNLYNDSVLIPIKEFLHCVKTIQNYKKEWERKIQKGDAVVLTDGPFKDFTGIAIEDQVKDKVKVEINSLFSRKIECEFSVKNMAIV